MMLSNMPQNNHVRLLAIVAVPSARRVMCQQPGCGHSIYAAIHVVEENGSILVLGSKCFVKRYGHERALGEPSYSAGGGNGSVLSEEQRQMLINNAAELMACFKDQHEQATAASQAKLRALRERFVPPAVMRRPAAPASLYPSTHPWPWQHEKNGSVGVVRAPDGQCWIRVQHKDGSQKIVPWPVFDGWDETFPPSFGVAETDIGAYSVPNIMKAMQWLKERGFSAPEVSRWPEVLKVLPRLPEVASGDAQS